MYLSILIRRITVTATGAFVYNYFLLSLQLIPWPQPGWLSSWTQDFTAACAACSLRRRFSSGCWKSAIFDISVILYPWKQVYRKCIVFSAIMASTFPLLWLLLLLLLELPLWSKIAFFSRRSKAIEADDDDDGTIPTQSLEYLQQLLEN